MAARDAFSNAHSLGECLKIASDASMLHSQYQHYTTFSRALQILKHRRLWLTRGDSEKINDQIEWQKYGPTRALWKKTFQASFSYGTAERAFMWHAYGPRDWQSVRLSVTPKGMQEWRTAASALSGQTLFVMNAKRPDDSGSPNRIVEVESADIHDILYLAVDDKNRYDRKRNNCAAWDMATNHFETMPDDIRDPALVGWAKDYEWRDERETRIVVKTKKAKPGVDFIELPIPESVMAEMSLTFGPWASVGDIEAMKAQLKTALSPGHERTSIPRDFFKRSFLAGALGNWENK